MKKSLSHWFLLLAIGLSVPCQARIKVYYLRHAESGSNAKKEWKDVPSAQRPAWVGDSGVFSPKGEQQAARVPQELAPYHFDFIAVSPKWRTRHTILPYLKANDRKAEIWPELTEFGSGDGDTALIGAPHLPPPNAEILTAGPKIELSADERAYLTLRADGLTEPKLGTRGAQGAADLTFMMKRVIDTVRTRFGGTDKSVLLVGHGNAGRHLLELLTGDRETTREGLRNVGLWLAEEQPDGSFKLTMANGRPLAQSEPKAAVAKP